MKCMKMNWKILFVGSFLIIAIFSAFVGYQFIKNRNNNLNIPGSELTTQVTTFENGYIPPSAKQAIEQQVKEQNQLIRGTVTSFDNLEKTVTIAMDQRQLNGSYSTIGLIDFIVDEQVIEEYLCWPEVIQGFDGTQIDIKTAYMGFSDNAYLYLQGETKEDISQLFENIAPSSYVFALLSSPLKPDSTAIVEDTSDIGEQYVSELAILGCNEND